MTSLFVRPAGKVPESRAATGCDLCDEISGGTGNPFRITYGEALHSRVIASTPDFAILPSMGQIVPGYLLIVPVAHIVSLAKLEGELLTRLEALICKLSRILSCRYATPVLFEHGLSKGGTGGGCGVEHAHLHLVPFNAETAPVSTSGWTRLAMLADLTRFSQASYLLYGDEFGLAVSEVDRIPSQFMRRALAEAVGHEDWDWRRQSQEPRLLETFATVSSAWSTDSHDDCCSA